jgi:ubiquinone/menaquinone biosynthesis C-methylase UbiE
VVADLRQGLPFPAGSFDAAVGIHVMQDLAYLDVVPALRELHRVLRPGGVLRLGLPDLDRALDAYRQNDADYFLVPDEDAASVGGKLVAQLVWYGSVRTPFTFDCVAEMLAKAGFRAVRRCAFGETVSGDAALASLDNRERESLFVEAERTP